MIEPTTCWSIEKLLKAGCTHYCRMCCKPFKGRPGKQDKPCCEEPQITPIERSSGQSGSGDAEAYRRLAAELLIGAAQEVECAKRENREAIRDYLKSPAEEIVRLALDIQMRTQMMMLIEHLRKGVPMRKLIQAYKAARTRQEKQAKREREREAEDYAAGRRRGEHRKKRVAE